MNERSGNVEESPERWNYSLETGGMLRGGKRNISRRKINYYTAPLLLLGIY